MLKTAVILELAKDKNNYSFVIPVGASYDEIYNVLREMRAIILDLAKKADEKAKKVSDINDKESDDMEKEDIEKEDTSSEVTN